MEILRVPRGSGDMTAPQQLHSRIHHLPTSSSRRLWSFCGALARGPRWRPRMRRLAGGDRPPVHAGHGAPFLRRASLRKRNGGRSCARARPGPSQLLVHPGNAGRVDEPTMRPTGDAAPNVGNTDLRVRRCLPPCPHRKLNRCFPRPVEPRCSSWLLVPAPVWTRTVMGVETLNRTHTLEEPTEPDATPSTGSASN